MPGVSGIDDNFENSPYVPGAGKPKALILSAIKSTANASSLYSYSNIRCKVLNIGPVTFQ